MKIIYFGIENCELEIRSGNPTIIAPEGIDEERLTEYDFIQLVDGRWCHYMDELETAYYVNHENTEVLSFPPPPSFSLVDIKEPDNSKSNLLTGLFVIIFLTGIAAIFFELYELSVICIMISFLLLTVTRILHPRHKASGTIAKVLSALFITAIIAVIIAIHILISALNDLADQTCDCVEGVGKIGAQYINFME